MYCYIGGVGLIQRKKFVNVALLFCIIEKNPVVAKMAAIIATLTLLMVVALEIVVAGQEYRDNATTPCCPLGYYLSSNGTNCQCGTNTIMFDGVMPCQPEKLTVELKVGYCPYEFYFDNTSNSCSNGFLDFGYCPYYALDVPMANRIFMKVPQYATPTNIIDYFCSGLNREGEACINCKKGYGPAVYSMEQTCGECSHSGTKMVALLALNIIPTTILFVIIMVFRVSAASGAMLVYVLHSQLVWLTARSLPYVYKPMNEVPVVKYLNVFSIIVGGIWSLDYFRPLIPPFCVQPFTSNYHVIFIEFIPAVLFLFLLIASYVGIKLHSRNFTPIVVLCNPVHRLLIKLERNYDSKASVINAFTTFMLLSTSKSMVAVIESIYTSFDVFGSPFSYISTVTLILIWTFSGFMWLFGICIPVCLLILFSFKHCAACFVCCNRTRQRLRAFTEIVTGSYKDGTGNTWNFRYVPSLLILLFIACFVLTSAPYIYYYFYTYICLIFVLIFSSMSLFFALCRPCKYSHTNTVASLIFFCTASQNLVLFLWMNNLDISTDVLAYSYALLVSLPQASFVCYVVYRILKCIPAVRHFTETAMRRCKENRAVRYLCWSDYEPLTGDSLPDRLENSVQYRRQLATNSRATPATGGRQDTNLHTTATYGAM